MIFNTEVKVNIEEWNKSRGCDEARVAYEKSLDGRKVLFLLHHIEIAVKSLVNEEKLNFHSKHDNPIIQHIVKQVLEKYDTPWWQDEERDERSRLVKILLPMKGSYARKIMKGEKAFVYRHSSFGVESDTMLIYKSDQVKKIVGECKIIGMLCCDPLTLWNLTKEYAGMKRKDFFEYFKDCDKACAYAIGNVNAFKTPKNPSAYGLEEIPESFNFLIVK